MARNVFYSFPTSRQLASSLRCVAWVLLRVYKVIMSVLDNDWETRKGRAVIPLSKSGLQTLEVAPVQCIWLVAVQREAVDNSEIKEALDGGRGRGTRRVGVHIHKLENQQAVARHTRVVPIRLLEFRQGPNRSTCRPLQNFMTRRVLGEHRVYDISTTILRIGLRKRF